MIRDQGSNPKAGVVDLTSEHSEERGEALQNCLWKTILQKGLPTEKEADCTKFLLK